MKFWDSSAILPLVVREASTPQIRSLVEDETELLVWWATRIETLSAVARIAREGGLSTTQVQAVLEDLGELLRTARVVEPTNAVIARAERLLFNHALRAAAALQLAAALVAAQERPQEIQFVTLDQRLRLAAGREGFTVTP